MTIYDGDRITVTVNTTNQNKVTLADKYGGGSMSMNKAAFEQMCVQVAKDLEERNAKAVGQG